MVDSSNENTSRSNVSSSNVNTSRSNVCSSNENTSRSNVLKPKSSKDAGGSFGQQKDLSGCLGGVVSPCATSSLISVSRQSVQNPGLQGG
ncbi:hypothetical protein PoB_001969500 [Plakobranchus ocellatus]|uniref:Uncharacterized protein n=1 Tax=Plakobranchus ocellatus TaxID=259542 RepID=A0AAV3ZF34_9GAST|nr:hypothetical protein PoB_001969500 [Plakobranchus ocellatus]